MEINELSANIDQKLADLEQQLSHLHSQQAQTHDPVKQQQYTADITALKKVRLKLLKSRDIAWRAHQLIQEQDDQRINDQKRMLGLALCVFSAVGALVLIGIYFWSGLF